MKKPILEYDSLNHEFRLIAPTPRLHQRARGLPAARERKKRGDWIIPATPAVLARISRRYRGQLLLTRECDGYRERVVTAVKKSAMAFHMKAEDLPEIPRTKLQPHGKWLHQRRAFWFAEPLEAAMLDLTMGGGKTKIAIDLMCNWQSRDVLIISPLAAIEDAWMPGLEKHVVGTYAAQFLNSGSVAKKMERAAEMRLSSNFQSLAQFRIVVINHESFWREPFASWATNTTWDLVIADEIHREKSAGSMSSKFLNRLGMRAYRRLGLTGTLMPHSPLDVYGQYRFLDRGLFGTNNARFEHTFAEFGGFEDREVVRYKNLTALRRKIDTITIHVDDSAQGLPETIDIKHSVKLESGARRLYDELDKEFIAQVQGGEITAANVGVKLLRLHQIACGFAPLDSDEKVKEIKRISTARIDGLRDVLMDFSRDEPIVVFTRFKPSIDDILLLCKKLRRSVSEISGRVNNLPQWKKGKTDVLVAQIQAVKEGVDLTRSSVGIFFSTGINLGDYLQCRKRLHRPPQDRMVRFIHLLASGTRDVTTMYGLQKRHDVVREVLKEIKR